MTHPGRTTVIPSDLAAVPPLQEEIGTVVGKAFAEHEAFAVKMAVEEALVNAIKHGNQLDPDKTVRVHCDVEQNRVYVEIEDQGPGYVPDEVPDPTLDENIERASGRGLMLIKSFMNHVEFNEKGNCIRMEKLRSSGEEAE
jgi:serine/threonine-protein kinase RsbW